MDEAGTALMIDTLRAAWSADPSLRRVSLFNADTDDLLPGISGQDILAAQVRNCRTGSDVTNCANSLAVEATDPYGSFRTFELRLEPKGATTSSTAATAVGEVPDEVKT